MYNLVPTAHNLARSSAADMLLTKADPAQLQLEDAVTVIRNLTISTHSIEAVLKMKEVKIIVTGKVQEALLDVRT